MSDADVLPASAWRPRRLTPAQRLHPWRVALVGGPNSGKTTLFNTLTRSRQKTANYAGVTVERKSGILVTPARHTVEVIDLPGSYSLRARSPDEAITRDVVLGRQARETMPDVIICVSDATNLGLHLRLLLELKKVGRPIILALNMIDIARRNGCLIDIEAMARTLGVPVVATIALRSSGVKELVTQLDDVLGQLTQQALQEGRAPAQGDSASPSTWKEPSVSEIRAYHQEIDQILKTAILNEGTPERFSRQVDNVLLHPVFGFLMLLAILFLIFQAVFTWAAVPMDWIEAGFAALQAWIGSAMDDGMLKSLLVDGIIAGVGGVVIFLPQIMILFFFILLLEDWGYMARAAFLMDRIMGGVGLNGRAFIPLLSSFACAIPGIMGARAIAHSRDRLITIMIAPLMTCAARLPVYVLLIAAFIPNTTVWGGWVGLQGLVMFGLYAAGIVSALLVAWVLQATWMRGEHQPLIMELPSYKMPSAFNVMLGLWDRAWVFLYRAGTIILTLMVLLWFLASFPGAPADATQPAIYYSFAGMIGRALEPLLAPIGFNWQIAIALVPGMAAREVAVAALGTVYALSGDEEAVAETLTTVIAHDWTLATALALLAWYVFAPQCLSTLAITKRETNSWTWPLFMFGYMMALAYVAAFITYHLAVALGAG